MTGGFPHSFCFSKIRYVDVTGPYSHYIKNKGNTFNI